MKKKTPPVRYSKQTQTYPLRGDPVVVVPEPQHSPEISPQPSQETTSETLLQSSSMTSFKPRMSKPLDLQSSIPSMQPSISSMEITGPNAQTGEKSSSFVMWVPKPRQFTVTASASLIPPNFKAVSSGYYNPQTIYTPPYPVPSSLLDPSIKSAMKRQASEATQREPSPSIELSQSYQDSINFFGPHAVTTTLETSLVQPSELRKSFLKPRFSKVLEMVPSEESSNNNSSKRPHGRYSGVSEGSTTYSAASNVRQYSNPFLNPYKVRKPSNANPRSVSQALSEMSRSATLRTRFAVPEQVEDGVKAVPFCGRCKCCYKFCMGCSVFDPICNIPCCFPYIQLFWLCTVTFGFIAIWIALFAIWGEAAWPGGEIFEFYSLAICAYAAGWVFACINIPPSLGMFAAGILFGNMGWAHTRSSISATTRAVVVAFVLLRAGLNTDANIFKTRGGLISRLAFIPGLSEMFVATMFGFFLLKLPWFWALLFGSIIAALSPLAIIYSLVWLRENGYGENKGITSVMLMMYALDNITLVTLFGIFFTLTFDVQFTDGPAIGILILQTLACICGGIGVGFIMGTFITFFPHRYDPYCGVWRTLLLSSSGLGTILLTHILNWDGAGYLCTIVMSFTASVGWKALGTPNCVNPVNMVFAMGWHLLQPIALGLIGAEVNIAMLERRSIKEALIVIPCCMMTRFSMAYLMSGMAGFNWKERLFMALLSMTKGTPQAALAPMTMDLAQGRNQTHFAKQLLDVCVLEVLITLPLGPLIASFMGTKLLSRSESSESRASYGTYLPRHESWSGSDPPVRQRFRSVVSRINTDNEFMLFTETGGEDSDDETYM